MNAQTLLRNLYKGQAIFSKRPVGGIQLLNDCCNYDCDIKCECGPIRQCDCDCGSDYRDCDCDCK